MRRKVISLVLVICLVSTFFPVSALIGAAASMEDQVSSAVFFEDTGNHWAGEAASRLAGEGIMTGYNDGRFHLNDPVTRAEIATILNRIFQYTEKGSVSFSDVSVSSWYADDLLKVQQAGIVEGYGNGRFMPNAPILRQDGFLMLSRAFHLKDLSDIDLTSFSDGEKVTSYARSAVKSMVVEGYVKGDNTKKLNPQGLMTRAEVAVILDQMIGWISPGSEEYSTGVTKGNTMINRPGASLKNSTISGSLYVTEGVAEGEFRANNITVSGSTFITGGGVNSVIFEQSKLASVFLNKKSGPIRLALNDSSTVESVTLAQKAKVEVSSGSHLAVLTVGPGAAGSSIVNKGTIGLLEVKADSVLLNGLPVNKGSHHDLRVSPSATPQVTSGSNSAVSTSAPVLTPTSEPTAEPTSKPTAEPTSKPTAEPTSKPTATPSWPPMGSDMWEMVWNDEFDSDFINTDKWNIENTGTVYNNELEYYHPNNASIQEESGNNVLVLEAKKESFQGRNYTSAKLTSKMKGDWTYGKFSIRAKLPIQQGMWPAIWMMPTDEFYQYGPWPGSGEIDIMELTGPKASDPANADKYPRTVHGSLHYNIPQISKSEKYILPEEQTFADDYHEFTLEWLPGLIRYYVDGEMFFETSDWGTQGDGQPDEYTYPAPFDRPFYMILNLAVGGDWPGDPKSDFVSDKMYVDYVRVYEYKDMNLWPDVTGKRPGNTNVTPQRPSLPDGNQIYNGDFTGELESSGVPENWQFIVNEGGQGSVSVVDDPEKGKVSKVTVDSQGTVNYSLQLTQMPLLLEKGKTYKVTFEAKADAARSFMSKLTEFDGGWTAYSKEHTLELTDQWQTYEYTFAMKDPSDNNVRFEFNLGLSAIASYFTNVKVVETEPVVEIRKPLGDGNWIYNGKFELGKDRMEFWDFNAVPEAGAVATVTNKLEFPQMDRKFSVTVQNEGDELEPNAVTLSQGGLPLTPGSSYQLSFDGRADRDLSIQALLDTAVDNVGYPDGSVINMTTETKSFSMEIHVDESAADTSTLLFLLGKYAGQVEIDNVRLILIKNQPSYAGYIHLQADNYFAQSGTEFVSSGEGNKDISGMNEGDYVDYKLDIKAPGSYVPMVRVASVHEDAELKFTIMDESLRPVVTADTYGIGSTGGVQSYRTVTYDPTSLSAGIYYIRLSGHNYNLAWLDITREMVTNGGFDSGDMSDWTLFKKDWDANDPVKETVSFVNNNALEVMLGGTGNEPWNVQVKQPGMPLEKGNTYVLSFNAHSSIDRRITALVQHDGSQDNNWFTYLEQTAALSEEDTRYEYIFTALENEPSAVLQFSLGKIDEILGKHSVVLDNISLLRINPILTGHPPEQPYDENLLSNGDFSSGISGWSVYSTDNDQLSIGNTDESLEIAVGSVGNNSWDRQVYYEGITYNQGNSYTLTFKAKATTYRKMNVSVGWSDSANDYKWIGYTNEIIDLGTDEQTYTIDFVASDSTSIGRVSFELGNIEGGASSDLSVFIDDINLVKK